MIGGVIGLRLTGRGEVGIGGGVGGTCAGGSVTLTLVRRRGGGIERRGGVGDASSATESGTITER